MKAGGAAALDLLGVVLFATIGRMSHAEGVTLGGVLETAWPFLVGAVVAWAVLQAGSRRSPVSLWFGIIVALSAVVIGMPLRLLTGGGGVQPSFVLVAVTALTLLLVGWRVLAVRLNAR